MEAATTALLTGTHLFESITDQHLNPPAPALSPTDLFNIHSTMAVGTV